MKMEIFMATVQHDNGTVKFKVIFLNGRDGTIQQITAIEGCHKSAIVGLAKIDNH